MKKEKNDNPTVFIFPTSQAAASVVEDWTKIAERDGNIDNFLLNAGMIGEKHFAAFCDITLPIKKEGLKFLCPCCLDKVKEKLIIIDNAELN